MRIAIHQPQYLPWLPYILKIEEADLFIVLDTVDFQKNGLQNRNQIKTAQGEHWLTVPIKQHLGQKIIDVEIDNNQKWKKKHWQTIQQCYGKAPAFGKYKATLEKIYFTDWKYLSDLNIELIHLIMSWMGIHTPITRSSVMNASGVASELVLNLCIEAGATEYLSGSGGKNYLDSAAFERAGVEIVYHPQWLPKNYPQQYPKAEFINTLSVIDLLFNCGDEWKKYLT